MTRVKWLVAVAVTANITGFLGTTPAKADVTSDRAAAILLFPQIVARTGEPSVDTIIQISNTSTDPAILHCFYVNATSHCSSTNDRCSVTEPCGSAGGICEPGWIETDFFVYITPRQPLAWQATVGLADSLIPLDGDIRQAPDETSNKGTRVPPIAETDYDGELKCIVVDDDGRPIPSNVVKGEATIVREFEVDSVDVSKYNAVGLQAFEADVNDDRVLVLGGGTDEYAGCPNVLIVDHFFDFAANPANGQQLNSGLTLIPCTQDLLNQIPGSTTAQFLVFNEFEQRFSSSAPIECYFNRPLSRIDTSNPERSIFSVFVAGTLAGQTRVRGVQEGLVGILTTESGTQTAAFNLHTQGDREQSDFITLP